MSGTDDGKRIGCIVASFVGTSVSICCVGRTPEFAVGYVVGVFVGAFVGDPK